MNTLKNIRDKYKITNIALSDILDVNKSTINTLLDRPLDRFTVKQIVSLHKYLDVDFNILIGENIFTLNNIGDNDNLQTTSILNNSSEYNRLFDKLKEDLKKELSNNKE